MLSGNLDMINKDADRQGQGINPSTWAQRIGTYSSLPSGSSDKAKMVKTSDPMSRPSKLVKLDEGRSASVGGVHLSTSVSGQSQVSGAALFRNQTPEAGEAPNSEKKVQVMRFSFDINSLSTSNVIYEPRTLVFVGFVLK